VELGMRDGWNYRWEIFGEGINRSMYTWTVFGKYTWRMKEFSEASFMTTLT